MVVQKSGPLASESWERGVLLEGVEERGRHLGVDRLQAEAVAVHRGGRRAQPDAIDGEGHRLRAALGVLPVAQAVVVVVDAVAAQPSARGASPGAAACRTAPVWPKGRAAMDVNRTELTPLLCLERAARVHAP